MGFTTAELEAARDLGVDDLVGPGLRLLFVGINPGLWSAAANAHFARRGNRFYPALARAGLVDTVIDASAGMRDEDRSVLVHRGIGITNLCARATARAEELAAEELLEGHDRLRRFVLQHNPRVVAILGVTAYRIAFGKPRATVGRQPENLEDADLWVVPNPSGLNAHASLDALSAAFRDVALAAGILTPSPDPRA